MIKGLGRFRRDQLALHYVIQKQRQFTSKQNWSVRRHQLKFFRRHETEDNRQRFPPRHESD